eukprot:gnl/MRDRNA2_/MRDRNA2_131881_c0_seq1.p1 gnl/MRDRNA2_/MRDRNA2_131881_c0~~gnl/MRDRNA2_/MRDRNA2_131881_c0_seq1.p1  ORF type:complete len:657 (-),score=87.20 gnl/MRDRNA2_/MRDRNA2_131881_c0_seq1:149-2119(-)
MEDAKKPLLDSYEKTVPRDPRPEGVKRALSEGAVALSRRPSSIDHDTVCFLSVNEPSSLDGTDRPIARRLSLTKVEPEYRSSLSASLLDIDQARNNLIEEHMNRMQAYGKEERTIRKAWFVQDAQMSTLIWFNGLYFYVYAAWIIGSMLTGALVMWFASDMDLLTALFTAACCVSQSGLAVVDWHAQNAYVHITSFFVILAGSAPLLTIAPPLLRRHAFRLQRSIEQRDSPSSSNIDDGCSDGTSVVDPELERELNAEYNALGMVVKLALSYWFLCHAVGFLVMYFYIISHEDIQSNFQQLGLGSIWTTLYMTVSCFQNNGLVITPSSLESFNRHPLILFVCGTLIMAGNTCLPIAVRFMANLAFYSHPAGEKKDALAFLLNHPRRCYTHMFPPVHTLWLSLCVVVLLGLQYVVFFWQDGDRPVLSEYEGWDLAANLFFQASTTRTAGLNSVDIFRFSFGSCYLMVVMMYLSCTPTVVMMRHSALEAGEETELDITGRSEGLEEAIEGRDNSLKAQASRYLTQHLTYLTVIVFFILVFEKENFEKSSEHASPVGNGIYGDFSFFKVIFEMASAYGTVGLSLGYRNAAYSFSGAWCQKSQFLLILAMLLGRLRGLPDSIDPSVSNFVERRTRTGSDKMQDSPRKYSEKRPSKQVMGA